MKKYGMPLLIAGASALLIGIFIIGNGGGSTGPSAGTNIEGVKDFGKLEQKHTPQSVQYAQTPAVGGAHDPNWLDCTGKVYDAPVRQENAVHSLEHGAVWVTYKAGLSQDDIKLLESKVEGTPYTFISPFADQPEPVMLSAWSKQLGVTTINDARIDQFLTAYRQSSQAPEPGAPCTVSGGGTQTAPSSGLMPGETAEEHARETQQ